MKLENCPECESDDLGDHWVKGRKLQQYCHDCGWKGEPRIPEIEEIKTTKRVQVNQFHGFNYEIFDRYGCIMIHSQSYHTKKEAEVALKGDLQRNEKEEIGGPCTAILWPDVVTVNGEVYK